MAPSSIRKALGAVKDQTSIGIAKVSNSTSLSDLEVAIVKATRHEEYPADERYVREILSLTSYSRIFISSCVNIISRRLNKTKNWTVALKTLMLIHRLLLEGDSSYEQEIFFATRRGTRLLNLSDFRDTSQAGAWDYSSFVRTYALYLDERLEYRMHGRRKRVAVSAGEEEEEEANKAVVSVRSTPVREMNTGKIFMRTQHLLNLLERFLACRPTGDARNNRVVLVGLYPVVKESFQIYFDITEITGILVDRFMELEVPECVKMHEIFSRIGKQFDELELYYSWCKSVGICRSSEYPHIEPITQKKLEIMDEFIREKSAMANNKKAKHTSLMTEMLREHHQESQQNVEQEEEDMNAVKALPAPEGYCETQVEEEQEEETQLKEEIVQEPPKAQADQGDLLNLYDDAPTCEQQEDKFALALFDDGNGNAPTTPAATSAWVSFNSEDSSDWETALVQSASKLSVQQPSLAGGFDTMLLDSMYKQQTMATAMSGVVATGSASSVALGSAGRPAMLALPAPPVANGGAAIEGADPFAASLAVPAPSYVQISDLEKKQKLLVEEQVMWNQYATSGMQSHLGMGQYRQNTFTMGGYS